MSVGVIVVAAGRGERLGGNVPKQFLVVGNSSMLERSVRAFDGHPDVTQIVVVLPGDLLERGRALVGRTRCPVACVAGGLRRQDSVRAGLAAVDPSVSRILIHDAARPFADRLLIDRVIAAVDRTGAAVPAMPAKETVKRVSAGSRIVAETVPRAEVWLAQTPQGFRREVLEAAVAGRDATRDVTDEATLVEQNGAPVELVPGDERNMKITTSDDLTIARARVSGAMRVGTGYDLHRLVQGRVLVLAGVVLPSEAGPLAHSDGDVVCHALTDAILGAAGCGDIGQHFPNTDPRWKDAAGLDLLRRASTVVHERGWRVANVDVTVVLERPKVASHVASIRQAIAEVLSIGVDCVSVKGKTNEGVDAVGEGAAIAAHAVAMLIGGSEA